MDIDDKLIKQITRIDLPLGPVKTLCNKGIEADILAVKLTLNL
ncbi:hypothetical protein [Candidatus Fukatsuia symbiotica]|nr:hypothetical protein [Candidatus Fukatsuia symbiotica]